MAKKSEKTTQLRKPVKPKKEYLVEKLLYTVERLEKEGMTISEITKVIQIP